MLATEPQLLKSKRRVRFLSAQRFQNVSFTVLVSLSSIVIILLKKGVSGSIKDDGKLEKKILVC